MVFRFLFIACLLVCATFAQPAQRSAEAVVVNESERQKWCPSGYEMVGKQCARSITEQPEITCATGYELRIASQDCIRYLPLESECPPGFIRTVGICEHTRTSEKQPTCPAGFLLQADNAHCMHPVPLPDHEVCPAGAEARGDTCIVHGTEEPQLVCPTGYVLSGNKCEIAEDYDCTPDRAALFSGLFDKGFRRRRLAGRSTDVPAYTPLSFTIDTPPGPGRISAPAGFYEDYIVQSTCKRIRLEPAREICSSGHLEGKVCMLDIQVRSINVPGGTMEEVIPATLECRAGYSLQPRTDTCSYTDEVAPTYFCPIGAERIGDRCAFYSAIRQTCDVGFALEGSLCVQTLFTPPLVEYTVTYACVGKECS